MQRVAPALYVAPEETNIIECFYTLHVVRQRVKIKDDCVGDGEESVLLRIIIRAQIVGHHTFAELSPHLRKLSCHESLICSIF